LQIEPETSISVSFKAIGCGWRSENETDTIRNHRERGRQCEDPAEYAMGEQIRGTLIDEQDHQIALATALGKSVPSPGNAA
jgi:bacterioferritin